MRTTQTARYGRDKEHEEAIAKAREKVKRKMAKEKKSIEGENLGLTDDDPDMPPLYNPNAKTN